MAEETPPPKITPRLKTAPKIRQLYWCDFPKDAQLPEFWKRRPVIVLSYRNTLHGAATVIPCSTLPQIGNKWAVPVTTTLDSAIHWAICDKVTTVAVSRLSVHRGHVPRLSEQEFDSVLQCVLEWLPKPTLTKTE
jgi:mRNA interferase MazF